MHIHLDREQLGRSLVRVAERRELPKQDHIASVKPDTDLSTQEARVADLERDTLSEAARDTTDRHSAEDRNVQDNSQADAQVHRVIRDDDLVKLDVSVGW